MTYDIVCDGVGNIVGQSGNNRSKTYDIVGFTYDILGITSLAHHKESRQSNFAVQDSVAWGSEVGTADPGNLVHHRCSNVAPHLCHHCQVLHEEQELADGTFSQLC